MLIGMEAEIEPGVEQLTKKQDIKERGPHAGKGAIWLGGYRARAIWQGVGGLGTNSHLGKWSPCQLAPLAPLPIEPLPNNPLAE